MENRCNHQGARAAVKASSLVALGLRGVMSAGAEAGDHPDEHVRVQAEPLPLAANRRTGDCARKLLAAALC